MGQTHSQPHDKGKHKHKHKDDQKEVATPTDTASYTANVDDEPDVGLACIVDGVPSTKKTRAEREREFWNSIMIEGATEDMNDYAKAFPYHPYLGRESLKKKRGEESAEANATKSNHGDVASGELKGKSKENAVQSDNSLASPKHDSDTSPFADFDFNFRSNTPSPHLQNQHQPTAPPGPENHIDVGLAHPIPSPPSSPPTSPTALTWNLILDRILTTPQLSPATISEIHSRLPTNALPSLQNLNLVPNVSGPSIASPFYDRVCPPVTESPSHPPELIGHENLTNNISPQPSPQRTPPSRPTNLPTPSPSSEEFTLLSSSSPPPSPTTQLRLQATTLATQTALIRTLHATIDDLTLELENARYRTIPHLCRLLEERDDAVIAYGRRNDALMAEITDFKKTVEFACRVVRGCWERERELERWVGGMRGKSTKRRSAVDGRKGGAGVFGRLFGRRTHRTRGEDEEMALGASQDDGNEGVPAVRAGETSSGSASTKQLDAIAAVAVQNLRVLREDVGDFLRLVEACKEHPHAPLQVAQDTGNDSVE